MLSVPPAHRWRQQHRWINPGREGRGLWSAYFWQTRALNTLGWIHGELQDIETAVKWNSRGVQEAQDAKFPDPEVESNARLNLGDNLLSLGRLAEAEEQYQLVERVARVPRMQDRLDLWRYSQHLFHSYGELCLLKGELERALAFASECLALAEPGGSRKNIVKGRRLRGEVLLAQGKMLEARHELESALVMAQRVGNPPQLWKTHAALGRLHREQSRVKAAEESFRDALRVIDAVATKLTDRRLRRALLTSAHVRSIRQEADNIAS